MRSCHSIKLLSLRLIHLATANRDQIWMVQLAVIGCPSLPDILCAVFSIGVAIPPGRSNLCGLSIYHENRYSHPQKRMVYPYVTDTEPTPPHPIRYT